ncbi:ent1 [Symbiodinium sp. CCMP2592]|nr:ent1 [Symbiodinium sp. CCMP2592]
MSLQEAVQHAPQGSADQQPQVSVNDVTQLAALVQAASSAAASAASAVARMQEQNDRGGERQYSGYTDASKVLKYPEGFGGGDSHEADLARWQEFSHGFRSWILYAEPAFESELDMIEKHPDVVITLSEMARATGVRARRLYAIMSGLLRGRPLMMLRAVEEHNGFELWHQLIGVYAPRTRARSLALLSAYMGYPGFVKERSIREQVNSLERISEEYQKDQDRQMAIHRSERAILFIHSLVVPLVDKGLQRDLACRGYGRQRGGKKQRQHPPSFHNLRGLTG